MQKLSFQSIIIYYRINMTHTSLIRVIIIIYSVFLIALSYITGNRIDENLLRWISGLTGFIVLIWTVFEKWIWKLPYIRYLSHISGTPVLHGTWKGRIEFVRDENGKPGSSDIYVSFLQTYTTITVRAYFPKPSGSVSIISRFEIQKSGITNLYYLYKNTAPHGKRDTNRPHDGTVVLEISGNPVTKIHGSYFTDRNGSGTVVLNKFSKEIVTNYEDAKKLKYK